MTVLAVIPARYASSRFPGKALALIAGKPMIQHVYERVRQARTVTRAVVATDDERILAAVKEFNGHAAMTRLDHRTGTDRVAEVAAQIEAEIYVNVQGDEPLIEPGAIDAAVEALQESSESAEAEFPAVATLCCAIRDPREIMDPNIVKVVFDFQGDALYFSRAPIPWLREEKAPVGAQHWKHLGLYVFRRDVLLEFPTLPPGELEKLEQLEQLRLLENGYKIRVVETEYDSVSVDTPEDLPRVEQLLASVDAASE